MPSSDFHWSIKYAASGGVGILSAFAATVVPNLLQLFLVVLAVALLGYAGLGASWHWFRTRKVKISEPVTKIVTNPIPIRRAIRHVAVCIGEASADAQGYPNSRAAIRQEAIARRLNIYGRLQIRKVNLGNMRSFYEHVEQIVPAYWNSSTISQSAAFPHPFPVQETGPEPETAWEDTDCTAYSELLVDEIEVKSISWQNHSRESARPEQIWRSPPSFEWPRKEDDSLPRLVIKRVAPDGSRLPLPVLEIEFTIANPGPPTSFHHWQLWVKMIDGKIIGTDMEGTLGLDADGDLYTKPLETGGTRGTKYERFHHALSDFDELQKPGTAYLIRTFDIKDREIKALHVIDPKMSSTLNPAISPPPSQPQKTERSPASRPFTLEGIIENSRADRRAEYLQRSAREADSRADFGAWDRCPVLTINETACLWSGERPVSENTKLSQLAAIIRSELIDAGNSDGLIVEPIPTDEPEMKRAIRSAQARFAEMVGAKPSKTFSDSRVTRENLRKYALTKGERPLFLFPEDR
jgi:hypothetical protein